jgi:signal transduction histidine kinase
MDAKTVAAEIPAAASGSGTLRFLLVEDDPLDVELLQHELLRAGFSFTAETVQTQADFVTQLHAHRPDVVLADYSLPHWSGMEALDVLVQEGLDVPLILVSGRLGEETAVECIKLGATDYVLKRGLARLPVAIRRAVQEHQQRERRRQAEEELAHKVEELARSNRELEQFAYVASHDLQEPLRMVASYTELLAERYRGKLDDQADKYIGYAVDGAKRMQRLIHDLLAYARVSSQPKPLQPTDASAVLADVLAQLRTTIEKNRAEVVCRKLPIINADQMQLGQVFQNLIGNAIKFRGQKPPRVEIRAERSGEMWDFAVADDGIGIPKENSDRIFQMFQRLHTREEYEGSGIGLAIAKRIVERHGGRIWFDSTPGEGTTFHFTIPNGGGSRREESRSNSTGGRQPGGRGSDAGDAAHQPTGNRTDGGSEWQGGSGLRA